ncbi:hypothetical protein Q4601_10275 [Shewanella sp. 1_MG-2023]|uniref:Uncharacterized protein n=1 Tax=Shewanella electrodiphila TaxID=934143 RepID=A0ABT0KTP0_9GAMM|nr:MULTISPECIES: hypothetical protein [Shewanella]MCL1046715.1 hypothetical protein [Shewanella electrodiphila]MDO6611203.1 hypothetical protein [Shewanella sp. 7_MG-2023]MDO6770920.1 hypothetical protein [Shewanella sp. 2_MG-2023]MDO6794693.1 hypothetical protein [Shewanella sp. 1_MG-2023]PMG79404.1 hypothetical protein BCU84_05820 [Shewanella sp. 10N.286.51.B7]
MNNISTQTTFSTTGMTKKLSLAATFFIALVVSSSSFAYQFDVDAQGEQAIKEHRQLMVQHMASAEQEYSAELNQDFDKQMKTAESKFLDQKCEQRGLDFDTRSEVCDG